MDGCLREAIIDLAGPAGDWCGSGNRPYATALHESGHTVALHILSGPVFRVSVVPDAVSGGRVFPSAKSELTYALTVDQVPGLRYRSTDTRQALAALSFMGFRGRALRKEFRRVRRVANCFVGLYFDPIRRLADQLMLTPELGGAACQAIIDRALGRLDPRRLPA